MNSNSTLREVLSQIKVPSKAVNSDTRLTNKYIYTLLKKYRDSLIRNIDGKFKLMKMDYLFQMWKCVELIEVSSVDECCNIKTDCKIFRTKEKLPPSLVSSWGPIIRDVTAIDGFTSLIMLKSTDWNRKLEDTNFKYDKDLYYFHQDGYLYFPNLKWKKIRVEAYFEEDIDKYNTCSDQQDPCKTFLDNKFIIPKELLDPCIKMVEAEIFNFYERLPEDEQPDKNSTRKN